MPNVNRPNGLVPVQHGAGGTPQRFGGYTLASGLAQDLFSGDPLVLTGNGRDVTIGVAAGPYVGVFAGVQFVNANGEQQFRPRWVSGDAGTEISVLVYDDPNQLFVVQSDGTGIVIANVGLNANLVAGAGNAFTGRSAWVLDTSTAATTAGLSVKVRGLARQLENDYGVSAKVIVSLNDHLLAHATAGV